MKHAADMPPAPSGQRVMPAPVRYPLLLVPATLGASSVATLLLYFYGVAELGHSVRVLLLPSTVALVVLTVWARRTGRRELYDRIMGGLWAGLFASLAYDIARIPIAHAGIPVFRAISYFGTVFLDQPKPTLASGHRLGLSSLQRRRLRPDVCHALLAPPLVDGGGLGCLPRAVDALHPVRRGLRLPAHRDLLHDHHGCARRRSRCAGSRRPRRTGCRASTA